MAGRLKILIALYYYHPYVSGLSLLAKMLAEGMANHGHEVTILTSQFDKSLPAQEKINGVNVVRAKVLARLNKGIISTDFMKRLVELSKTHDVVNPHLPMTHIGFVAALIDKKKLIPQYHCDLNLGKSLLAELIERVSYWSMEKTLQRSSKIVVTTKDYFSHSRFSHFLSKTVEIYPPIDESRFAHKNSEDLMARLGISKETKLVGFVGRIVAEKGLEYLLQSIPLLEKRLDDFLIVIVGEYTHIAGGSVMREIDSLVKQNQARVKFTGFLKFSDLVSFYNLIDVLVLPSVDPLEAFGMVQVEAMLCGTPVVASDMPGVREVVKKTGFGRLVNQRDPQDIADKVCELLDNPVVIEQNKMSPFSYSAILDKYEKVFEASE